MTVVKHFRGRPTFPRRCVRCGDEPWDSVSITVMSWASTKHEVYAPACRRCWWRRRLFGIFVYTVFASPILGPVLAGAYAFVFGEEGRLLLLDWGCLAVGLAIGGAVTFLWVMFFHDYLDRLADRLTLGMWGRSVSGDQADDESYLGIAFRDGSLAAEVEKLTRQAGVQVVAAS